MKRNVAAEGIVTVLLSFFISVGGHAEEASQSEVLFNEGREHAKNGRYEQAIEAFSKTIELVPKSLLAPTAHVHRGDAYRGLGQHDKALADYTRALELIPSNGQALFHRGRLYAETGKTELAVADLSKALEIDPGSAEAHLERGNAYEKLEDREKACADWKKASELGRGERYEQARQQGLCS